jgi:hypothetical protein
MASATSANVLQSLRATFELSRHDQSRIENNDGKVTMRIGIRLGLEGLEPHAETHGIDSEKRASGQRQGEQQGDKQRYSARGDISRRSGNGSQVKQPPADPETAVLGCLRCQVKGMPCSLTRFGPDPEHIVKCTRCERAGAEYCVRQHRHLGSTMVKVHRDVEQDEKAIVEFVRELKDGLTTYHFGELVTGTERMNFALPQWPRREAKAKLGAIEQPDEEFFWKQPSWNDVLPATRNLSCTGAKVLVEDGDKKFGAGWQDRDFNAKHTQRLRDVEQVRKTEGGLTPQKAERAKEKKEPGEASKELIENSFEYLTLNAAVPSYRRRSVHLGEHLCATRFIPKALVSTA